MVLTDRQRADLHAGIYEYLRSQPGDAYRLAAEALVAADPRVAESANGKTAAAAASPSASSSSSSSATPLLEKKWVAIPRLQKKVLELERLVAQSAQRHAHRSGGGVAGGAAGSNEGGAAGASTTAGRRLLPRQPYLHKLQGHSAVVTCVALHPVYTVVASGSEDGTVKIWDHESGEFLQTLKGHTNTVNGLDFTPRGTHLASCSADLSIKLWDLNPTNAGGSSSNNPHYVCVRTLRGHDHTISAIRFVPLPAPSLLSERENRHQPSSASNATNGGSGSGSGSSPGVSAVAAGCQLLLSASRDTTVKLWDIETGFCDHTVHDHSDWVRCLAVQGAGAAIGASVTAASPSVSSSSSSTTTTTPLWASSGNDTVIRVYEGRRRLLELRGHEHVVESLAFVTEESLKGSSSSSSTANRESKHWDLVRDYLASGSRDRTVRLWKLSEGTCLATFAAHENWVRAVLVHPGGKYVLSASDDKSIRVFDVANNRCLRVLEKAHDHFVTSLAIHPTLPVLVSGGVDRTVRCWQLD